MSAKHTPTIAHQVAARTDLDPRAHGELLCFLQKQFVRVSQDMDQFWFRDGSSVLAQYDDNLRPVAVVEVAA